MHKGISLLSGDPHKPLGEQPSANSCQRSAAVPLLTADCCIEEATAGLAPPLRDGALAARSGFQHPGSIGDQEIAGVKPRQSRRARESANLAFVGSDSGDKAEETPAGDLPERELDAGRCLPGTPTFGQELSDTCACAAIAGVTNRRFCSLTVNVTSLPMR